METTDLTKAKEMSSRKRRDALIFIIIFALSLAMLLLTRCSEVSAAADMMASQPGLSLPLITLQRLI